MARIVAGPYVTGRVTSRETGSPLGGGTVTVSDTVYTTVEMTGAGTTSLTVNGNGEFSFYAPPGVYTFTSSQANANPIEPVEVLGEEQGTNPVRHGHNVWTGSQDFSGATVVGLTATAVQNYVDPTVVDGRWSPSGMTSAGLSSGNSTPSAFSTPRATTNSASLVAALTYAAANALPVRFPAGTWDLLGQIKFLAPIPYLVGMGVDNTTLRFSTGAGLTSGTVLNTTDATTGYSVATADGLGTGLMVGNNTGNYAGPGGYIADLTITSTSGNAPTYSGSASTAVGLCINGVTQCTVERVRVTNFGVGYDLINNCGGTEFRNCTAAYHECNLGLMMRTGLQSGSDIQLFNCWLHGKYAGVCVENGATDLQIVGGQISANHGASQTVVDATAAVIINRNFLDGTIGSDTVPGAVPTVGVSGIGLLTMRNVDLEGTRRGYAAFRSYSVATIVIESCNIIAYQDDGTAGASYDVAHPGCEGVFKMTGASVSTVTLRGNMVKGAYVSTTLCSVAGNTSGFTLTLDANHGKQNTVINGFNSGNALTGNWLSVDAVSGSPTSLGRFLTAGISFRGRSASLADTHTDLGPVNTTTETTFATQPIPTSATVGDVLRLVAWGDLLNNTGGNVNYTPKAILGATTAITGGAASIATGTNRRPWKLVLEVLVVSATADQRVSASLEIGPSAASNWPMGAAAIGAAPGRGTATEDLTAGKNLAASMTLGTASASADFICHESYLEIVKR